MTVNGAKALEVELLRLKEEERPRIVSDIATAREHGDLKENAEYHAAKEEQGFIEGRIQEIDSKLSRMQLIDVKATQSRWTMRFWNYYYTFKFIR